jgi:hypothetical protein
MPEQIRMILTVDEAVKRVAEEDAAEVSDGNLSAYIRGLVVFYRLLNREDKDVGGADIPGWVLRKFPLRLIDKLHAEVEAYHKSNPPKKTFTKKHFYDRIKPDEPKE